MFMGCCFFCYFFLLKKTTNTPEPPWPGFAFLPLDGANNTIKESSLFKCEQLCEGAQ